MEQLTRLDGKPTVYATCECGLTIVQVNDEYWGTEATGGREIITNNHKHYPVSGWYAKLGAGQDDSD